MPKMPKKFEFADVEELVTPVRLVFFLVIAFQVMERIFFGPMFESDCPKEDLDEEIDNIPVILTPQSQWWLKDLTILREVKAIALDPRDVLGDKIFKVRTGLPKEVSGDPPKVSDDKKDICPSRALSERAQKQIRKTIEMINRFDIDHIFYFYYLLDPVESGPHELQCFCPKCMETWNDRFELGYEPSEIFEAVEAAMSGKQLKTYDDVRADYRIREFATGEEIMEGCTEDEIIDIRRDIDEITQWKKEVYTELRDIFKYQGELVKEFNHEVLYAIKENTNATIRVIPTALHYDLFEEEDHLTDYFDIAGFDPELMDEFEVECIFGRLPQWGGDLIQEFPTKKRGIYVYTGDDDEFNRRIISQEIESGEAFVSPEEDNDDLWRVLESLSIWGIKND